MLISVLTWCHSRQETLNKTLPLWLKQEGVDYEIVLGHGPDIKFKFHPKIKPVPTPNCKMCESYNKMLREARGELLLITQCDMEVTDTSQLKRMAQRWYPGAMVSEKCFKAGRRDPGIYLLFLLIAKKDIEDIGGWCELYDGPDTLAHEDSDMIASLLEKGIQFEFMETPPESAVYHLDHPRPDYNGDPVLAAKVAHGFEIYNSRHNRKSVLELFVKQFSRRLIQKSKGFV